MQNLYQNPANVPPLPDGRPGCTLTEDELQQNFDNFFADMFWEMEEKYGDVVDMNVCDNLGDHLVGNVYIMFKNEEDAEKAVMDLNNRWYNGKLKYSSLFLNFAVVVFFFLFWFPECWSFLIYLFIYYIFTWRCCL